LIYEENSSVLKFLIHNSCYFTYHVILSTYCYLLGDFGNKLKQKSFGNFLISCGKVYTPIINLHKEKVFAELSSSKEKLRILEIGPGPGVNFGFYPKNCDLLIVDPYIDAYEKSLRANIASYKGINLKECYCTSAEDMSIIPDNSVDAVITSDVLCSFDDATATLKEIKRVLKPGGKYYFVEHTVDKPGTLLRKLQDFFINTGLWKYWMCGCRFYQNPKSLHEANFSDVKVTNAYLVFKPFSVVNSIRPHVYGVATK